MRPARLLIVAICLAAAPAAVFGAEPPALAKARILYNAADYEGAIDAASVSRLEPEWADASALVIARAHLERYRQSANPSELAAAREALRTVRSDALTPRDQLDLLIGLGQALYLGELFGAAAELFDTALNRSSLMETRDRLMLLDWWATSLDREAQSRPTDQRGRIFERIVTRMEDELWHDAANPVANYWLAVGARGAGNLERAWSAAVAAWVRSGMNPDTAEQLRTDVDRLVTQALIAELARIRPPGEREDAMTMLQADWEVVKQQWK